MGQQCCDHAEFPDELFSGLYECDSGVKQQCCLVEASSPPVLVLRVLESIEFYFGLVAENINMVNNYSFHYFTMFLFLVTGCILTSFLAVNISDTPNNRLISLLSRAIKMSQVSEKNLNEDCSRSVCLLEQMGPHYWRNFTPNMNIAPGWFFFFSFHSSWKATAAQSVLSHPSSSDGAVETWRTPAYHGALTEPRERFQHLCRLKSFYVSRTFTDSQQTEAGEDLVSWCFCVYGSEVHQEFL